MARIPTTLTAKQLAALHERLPGIEFSYTDGTLYFDAAHEAATLDALCEILPPVQDVTYTIPAKRRPQHHRTVRNVPEHFVLSV